MSKPFDQLADDATINQTKTALEANGFVVLVTADGASAKTKALEIIPEGAEVITNTSVTAKTIGLVTELDESGRFDSIRAKKGEMRKLRAAPEWAVGSVHAITENGEIMIASQSGSQLSGYASGAANVLFVVGAQKIVSDRDEGFRRIYEYCLPLEDKRALVAYGEGSSVSKILILNTEIKERRTTLIFIKEKLGF